MSGKSHISKSRGAVCMKEWSTMHCGTCSEQTREQLRLELRVLFYNRLKRVEKENTNIIDLASFSLVKMSHL